MDSKTIHPGIELENRMLEAFTNEGWECKSASEWIEISKDRRFSPDITLTKNGHIYGFVECYILKDGARLSPRKQEQILFILDTYKPEIFILTNGVSFEVYYDGVYAGNMTVPISYNGYMQRKRIGAYAKVLMEVTNGKNNK